MHGWLAQFWGNFLFQSLINLKVQICHRSLDEGENDVEQIAVADHLASTKNRLKPVDVSNF